MVPTYTPKAWLPKRHLQLPYKNLFWTTFIQKESRLLRYVVVFSLDESFLENNILYLHYLQSRALDRACRTKPILPLPPACTQSRAKKEKGRRRPSNSSSAESTKQKFKPGKTKNERTKVFVLVRATNDGCTNTWLSLTHCYQVSYILKFF